MRQNVCVILRYLFEQAVIAKQDNALEDDEDVFGEAASFLIGREHFNMMYLVLRKMVRHAVSWPKANPRLAGTNALWLIASLKYVL